MALAFLLGLLLTLALTIRKVTREVPVSRTVSAGVSKPVLDKPDLAKAAGVVTATGAAAAAKLHGAADKAVEKVERVNDKVGERVERVNEKVGEKVGLVGEKVERVNEKVEKAVEKTVQKIHHDDVIDVAPYGSGSIRVTARKVGPAGYTIKGDKDTGRYFTSDSPEYEAIEAEVWFANEESAEKAGFLRWDAKGDRKAGIAAAGSAALVTESHVPADIVIRENHDADASLVVIDNGPAATGSPVAKVAEVAEVAEAGDAPYGKGSARAAAGGHGPAGWLIKGNEDSMLFHGPDSPYYGQTIAEVWFVDEATARAAGFDKWDINIKKK
jgi:hypothetical protein